MSIQRPNYTFTVNHDSSQRLDVYLAQRMPAFSRTRIHKFVKEGAVLVNGQISKPGYLVRNGDEIHAEIPAEISRELVPADIPLEILYEDAFFIAVNKPAGMVVHPGAGNFSGTLVGALLNYTRELSSLGGSERPGLVHRLDKDTSGVVVAARTNEAHWKLSRLFAERSIYKEYRAIVWGCPEERAGLIDAAIGRSTQNRKKFAVTSKGRRSRTRYEVLSDYDIISMLKVVLETGRTHQARIHLNHAGHPVVGDLLYGGGIKHLHGSSKRLHDLGKKVLAVVGRQMLHAHVIRFEHPLRAGSVEITAPLPRDFLKIQSILEESLMR